MQEGPATLLTWFGQGTECSITWQITNTLIRQHFTRGNHFENITGQQVDEVMDKLNHRPRTTPDYQTPHAVFIAMVEQDTA